MNFGRMLKDRHSIQSRFLHREPSMRALWPEAARQAEFELLLVFAGTQICSDLFRIRPICSDNQSEQIRVTPFCRPLLQVPEY